MGFSMFLGACLAGRSADEAGSREAFGWLDRRQKGAINAADVKLLTGEVSFLPLLFVCVRVCTYVRERAGVRYRCCSCRFCVEGVISCSRARSDGRVVGR